jgi:hypothetical protein
VGRFISEDPFGFGGGIDLYSYTYNVPTAFSDPLGLCCTVKMPEDPDAALLAKVIFAEATTGRSISPENSAKEMLAIASSIVNRVDYLTTHPRKQYMFPHTDTTIPGVVVKGQFGSLQEPRFKKTDDPSKLDKSECDFLGRSIDSANEALRNPAADPFQAGTFAFRTKGHGGPGGSFFRLPNIPGSNNNFWGLKE